jgi:hypothetical protein
MRYQKLKACLPSTLCLIAAHHAWGNTMRCGNGLIEVGKSMATVQALCGSPADVQHSVAVNATTEPAHGEHPFRGWEGCRDRYTPRVRPVGRPRLFAPAAARLRRPDINREAPAYQGMGCVITQTWCELRL